MAKVNVNTATRDDLVDVAGLRPEIADAVLEYRLKRHKITDARALEALPGVGPATLEQLRQALDFDDKGDDRVEAGERAAKAGARLASTAAGEGVEIVRRVFGAAETEREAVGGAAELSRLWVELLSEQTRRNLEVATALGRAVRWEEVVEAQGEFVRASLGRLDELNRRYLEIVQSMIGTTSVAAERARKAA